MGFARQLVRRSSWDRAERLVVAAATNEPIKAASAEQEAWFAPVDALEAVVPRRHSQRTSRQGPETLRWALYKTAKNSSQERSPDHAYYARLKDQHGGKIAAISIARLFTRRCYHILRDIDPEIVYAMPA